MKKLALSLLLTCALSLGLEAQTKKPVTPTPKRPSAAAVASPQTSTSTTATIAWDANDAADNVTAYKVYERAPDGATQLLGTTAAAVLTFTTAALTSGNHTYVITAMNTGGESLPSNPVSVPSAPAPPGNVRITINIEINP